MVIKTGGEKNLKIKNYAIQHDRGHIIFFLQYPFHEIIKILTKNIYYSNTLSFFYDIM